MDDRELLIRVDENVQGIKRWVDNHDCEHKAMQGDIELLKQWRWRWVGAIALLTFVLNWAGLNAAARYLVWVGKGGQHAEGDDFSGVVGADGRVRAYPGQDGLRQR